MTFHHTLLLSAAALLCGGMPLYAQTRPLSEPPAFALDQWTSRDGLPQNSVTAIAQTPDGYLWIGTFGGLARFDGTTFVPVERTDRAGRHVDRVLAIVAARDSSVWIGTETGLLRYWRGEFITPPVAVELGEHAIAAMHEDRSGAIWLGTVNAGLARIQGERLEWFRAVERQPLLHVTGIHEDPDGTLWINAGERFVTFEGGVLTTARWRTRPTPNVTNVLLREPDGARWFARSDGIVRARGATTRVFGAADNVRRPAGMVQDPGGGYWLTTSNDGAFFFQPDGGRAQQYGLPDGRAHYRVRASLVDAEGQVWFGTDADGLLRARRSLFRTYTQANGLTHDVITAVFADARGTVWVGTNCFGLNALDRERRTVHVHKPRRSGDPDGDPCVFALTENPAGVLWAGTWGGGLTRIEGGRETRLKHVPGLGDSVILALFTDRAGTTWVGTQSAGLGALRDGVIQATYTTAEGLAHNNVRAMYQSRDGALWIATLGGLSRLHDGRLTSFTAADGLSAEHVRAIHEDADGNLWIGTHGGGLNRLRDGAFRAIAQRDGLAEDVVSRIFEDDHGRIWLAGNRGISRVARAELVAFAEGRATRVHAVLYGEADGLRSAETNGGFHPAGWQDADGRIWYPTVQGVAMVDPARVPSRERPPTVAIEAVAVDGVTRDAKVPLLVGPGRPNLEFRYTALSLSGPQHLTFRYRLEGFDPDWVVAGTRRVAYYPRLPAGRYRFLVTAANRDGVWNDAGASLPLRVRPPLWNAMWFRLTAVAVVIALAVALLRRREAGVRSRRAAQEAFARELIASQEQERRRIAGELHDGLGQDLLVVKNRALLALKGDGLHAPAREQLRLIDEIATRSLETVRGLAHHLTPYQLDHLGLSAALRSMITGAAEAASLQFDVTIEPVDGLLPGEHEINLYRIVQEAVSNIVRHAGANSASVHVRHDGGTIVMTIRDDGRGFALPRDSAGRLKLGFGLSGMAERARILGGRIDFVSSPGRGTRIEVVAPVFASRASAI